jgi:hypothetical protein
MLLKLICCNVFLREACLAIAHSPHTVDPEFLELGEHARPDCLRQAIQGRIDAAQQQAKPYDAVLLLYGLCGNATIGLQARGTRLVIPRAHDCCTILLGSRERFRDHFEDNLSAPFSSVGYLERGSYYLRTDLGDGQIHYGDQYAALVDQYGEDNARYIWESMHPEGLQADEMQAAFIEIPETSGLDGEARFRARCEAEGKSYHRLDGDLRLIRALIHGDWNPEEFLVIEPGQQTTGVYDWQEVIRARPASSKTDTNQ